MDCGPRINPLPARASIAPVASVGLACMLLMGAGCRQLQLNQGWPEPAVTPVREVLTNPIAQVPAGRQPAALLKPPLPGVMPPPATMTPDSLRGGAASFTSLRVDPSLAAGAVAPGYQPNLPALGPFPVHDEVVEQSERCYSAAREAERQGDAACVDWYFQAAAFAWPGVELPGRISTRPAALYHSSLAKLLVTAQQFGRLDPRVGLTVRTPHGDQVIPLHFTAMPWLPEETSHLELVGPYRSDLVKRSWRNPGWGVPLVALYEPAGSRGGGERFLRPRTPFALTALLRPDTQAVLNAFTTYQAEQGPARQLGPTGPIDLGRLEFFDPLRFPDVEVEGTTLPLAIDITAPLVWLEGHGERDAIRSFLQPAATAHDDGLTMLEPYQRGKIPLVFVHGLASDPLTWIGMANELRADSELRERYQIWAFRYSSGAPFLRSAMELRNACRQAMNTFDPQGTDAALQSWVMVGHSNGGLITKLQVSRSGDALWDSISNRPLKDLVISQELSTALGEMFFFEPLPFIRRVVYIATPHNGSPWADRGVGQISSALVQRTPEEEQRFIRLVRANPGVFVPEMQMRVPNSVDVLQPNHPLLVAMRKLPLGAGVEQHSIIGTGRPMMLNGPADGVVPVSSARIEGVASETFIDATHTTIQHNAKTISTVRFLLLNHAPVEGLVPVE